jgi:NADH-quinone oxidoreductase subunit L
MFMAFGVAAFSAGIFHLMTHAFFKGLLFLAAGSVIHGVGGEQDMRKMGGLRKYMPVTFWTMTIATFAIAGIPPLAGFFSKDEILWMAYVRPHGSWIFWLIGVVTAFVTSFYMFRLWFMTFFGDYRGAAASDAHGRSDHGHGHGEPHESPWVMLGPLVVLAILSFVGGWVGIHHRFDSFLSPVFYSHAETHLVIGAEAAAIEEKAAAMDKLELMLTGVSVSAGLFGLYFAWLLYYKRRDLPERIAASLGGLYEAVVHKYYVDELYAALFIKPLIEGSTAILWKGVDQGVIDATVNHAAHEARRASDGSRRMQSGNLRSYAGWVAAGGAAVIAYMVWMGVR